jgi:hypothetical protein
VSVISDALSMIIEGLDPSDFSTSVYPFLVTLASTPTGVCRAIAAQIIVYISDFAPDVTTPLSSLVVELANDSSVLVRTHLPSLLSVCSSILPPTFFESAMLKLADDPLSRVRVRVLDAIVEFSQKFDSATRLSAVEPILLKLIADPSSHIRSLLVTRLGPILGTLGPSVNPALITQYTQFLSSGDPEISYRSAFSFPAVALALGSARFESELADVFERCIDSGDVKVRRTLAFGLVTFSDIMTADRLYNSLSSLLKDLSEVAIGVVSSLGALLPLVQDRETLSFALANPTGRFSDWRMRLRVSEQLRECNRFFARDELLESAVELMEDEVAAVRDDAALSFARLLKLGDGDIVRPVAESECHWTRLCAAKALQWCEMDVLKECRDVVVKLTEDPVIAVRSHAEIAGKRFL